MEIADLAKKLWTELNLDEDPTTGFVLTTCDNGSLICEILDGYSRVAYSEDDISLQIHKIGEDPVLTYSVSNGKLDGLAARLTSTGELGKQLFESYNCVTGNGSVSNSTKPNSLYVVYDLFLNFIKYKKPE